MAATFILNQMLDSFTSAALGVSSLVLTYFISVAVYNSYFHPLSRYPGPKWWAASRLPYCMALAKGTLPFDLLPLHEKYGDVVRVAPDELAFSHPDAWKDISSHKTSDGGEEMIKYDKFYRTMPDEPINILNAPRDYHRRLRNKMAYGFSDRGMKAQEPIIKGYIDLLIKGLRDHSAEPVNMTAWTTFDIIGDLAFGEPFGCLEKADYHPWVKMILENTKAGAILMILGLLFPPLVKQTLLGMIPASVSKVWHQARKNAEAKILRRIEMGSRPDLIDGLLQKSDDWSLDINHIEGNASILVIAGSETTATVLAGVTYQLLSNPSTLVKLTKEVRSTFKNESEITIESVGNLSYLLACLNETFRVYPPVAIGLPRVTPPDGVRILGEWVPGNTVVAIHQYPSYHRSSYFSDPFAFRPERFHVTKSTDTDANNPYINDQRDIVKPFSVGPRDCIGRNLAYAEMRLILAHIVWNFDLSLEASSKGWAEKQRVWFLREKGPLMVRLRERSD